MGSSNRDKLAEVLSPGFSPKVSKHQSPGPSVYENPSGIGKQLVSTKTTSNSYSFGSEKKLKRGRDKVRPASAPSHTAWLLGHPRSWRIRGELHVRNPELLQASELRRLQVRFESTPAPHLFATGLARANDQIQRRKSRTTRASGTATPYPKSCPRHYYSGESPVSRTVRASRGGCPLVFCPHLRLIPPARHKRGTSRDDDDTSRSAR